MTMLGPLASFWLASAPESPPKRLAESRPEPGGGGSCCSLALVGLGDVARVGASDGVFLAGADFLTGGSGSESVISIGVTAEFPLTRGEVTDLPFVFPYGEGALGGAFGGADDAGLAGMAG